MELGKQRCCRPDRRLFLRSAALLGCLLSCPASAQLTLPRTPRLPTLDELAARGGASIEHSLVETEDGYLVTLHRLGRNTGPPVLVLHGLANAADIWLTRENRTDLVFLLLDEGYDIYLGDMRGDIFSKHHTKLKTSDPRYWNFSFHEIGYYDLPAMIDRILTTRGVDQLFYLGHSLGTTVFFVMCSTRPEYNWKIRGAILNSPVAYLPELAELPVPLARSLAKRSNLLWKSLSSAGLLELLPRTASVVSLTQDVCAYGKATQDTCLDIFGGLFGEHRTNIDRKWISLHLSFYGAGTSLNTLIHLAQILERSEFRQMDFGEYTNMVRYKSGRPPAYQLKKVTAPVALFWSYNDNLVSERSANRIRSELPNVVLFRVSPDPKFTHVDLYVGMNAKEVLYDGMIAQLRRMR